MWLRQTASETQITHAQRLWLYLLGGLVMIFLVAPSLIVIPLSFSGSQYLEFPPQTWSTRWYDNYFGSIEWREATYTSLLAATLTALFATPLGTAAAYGLHVSRFGWARYVQAVLLLPMIVPIILIGVGAFFLYAKLGLLNTITGLVLVHTILAIPFVLIIMTAGFRTYDMNQELVARSLGASRFVAFVTVTLPQIKFSAISGALLAFLTSFDEVVIALFISGGERATITRRMFNALRDQVDPTIAAISTCLISVSILAVIIFQICSRDVEERDR